MSADAKKRVEEYTDHLKKACLEDRQKNKAKRIEELRRRYAGVLEQAREIGEAAAEGRDQCAIAKENLELRAKVVSELRALGEKVEDSFVP